MFELIIKDLDFLRENKKIISNINLKINKGDFIYLVGKNGSGKTTLSFILAGIIKNYSGEIIFNNKKITSTDNDFFEKNVGYVFQNPDNQFVTSIVENDLAFGLEKFNLDYEVVKKKIINVLKKLNIEHLLRRNIFTLSGGEKQMVAIASMILLEKKLIIFDESLSMIDNYNSKKIMEKIWEINKKDGISIIYITHDLNKIINDARIIKLKDGKIYE